MTVLGACGTWPTAGSACSGYLVQHDGFRLLVDVGYAVLPRLLGHTAAAQVDAVFVSHGHPDHCADLNPLLRARVLPDDPAPALPVYAPAGALDAVLALDRPGMLTAGYRLHEVVDGQTFDLGPFRAQARLLPHWVPDLGLRLEADGRRLVYTGDAGPSDDLVRLARGADLLLAEATYPAAVPRDAERYLSSAGQVAGQAAEAAVGSLLLTHLWPGTDPARSREVAATEFDGPVDVARPGLVVDL